MGDDYSSYMFLLAFGDYLVDTCNGIERAWITKVGKQLRGSGKQYIFPVTEVNIASNMCLDLRLTASERNQYRERKQFSHLLVKHRACLIIAKAVGRQVLLYMCLVGWSIL